MLMTLLKSLLYFFSGGGLLFVRSVLAIAKLHANEPFDLRGRIKLRIDGGFRIFLCLTLLLTTSCAVNYEKAMNHLIQSKDCCGSMAEFDYESIPGIEGITFKIDESSPAFVFQSGKSLFKAFQLPRVEAPYYIQVKSFGLGEHISKAHIFYPQLALLSDNFDVLKQSDAHEFSLKKGGLGETASISWTALPIKVEGSLFVDNPRAKYVVIFTNKKLLDSSSSFTTVSYIPLILPGVAGVLPAGKKSVPIPHSPFGMLHIKIADKPLLAAEEPPNSDRLKKRINELRDAQGAGDFKKWYEMTTPSIRNDLSFEEFKREWGADVPQEADFKIVSDGLHKICTCGDWKYEDGRKTLRCSLLVSISIADDNGRQLTHRLLEMWEYIVDEWYWGYTDHHEWENCPSH
jgi:hypothetical protein